MIPFLLQRGGLGRIGPQGAAFTPSRWRASDVSSPLSLANSGQRLVLAAGSSGIARTVPGDNFKSSGKWYAEILFVRIIPGTSSTTGAGVAASDFAFSSANLGTGISGNLAVGMWPQGSATDNRVYRTGGNFSSSLIPELDTGRVLMIAMDIDARKLWLGVDGSWNATANPAAGNGETVDSTYLASGKSWAPAGTPWSSDSGSGNETKLDILSGPGECLYTPPSGFSYW